LVCDLVSNRRTLCLDALAEDGEKGVTHRDGRGRLHADFNGKRNSLPAFYKVVEGVTSIR